ncbi:hypothetical protein RFI_36705, partial [Reticulomyxa filosa]
IYHLNISSCVSTQINDFLFQLLFLQHIDSNSQISQCFHVNSNMIFLIEIPSTLDYLSFDESIPNFFYLFFSAVQFPVIQVSNQNNPFEFEMETQDTIKWMRQHFHGNSKITNSPDFDKESMQQFMSEHFAEISQSNLVHQRSFFKYLHQQLAPLGQSPLKEKTVQSRHDIMESVIDMAKILCCRQHGHIQLNSKEKSERVESTGEEEFLLCKKWRTVKGFFLVNQDKGLNYVMFYFQK